MPMNPVQFTVQHKGRRYGGIYSVAGNLMIARIPGVDSRSHTVDGADEQELARRLFVDILEQAEQAGRLAG